jgi:lipopolysaccharide biosynthesis glycosyltransferase
MSSSGVLLVNLRYWRIHNVVHIFKSFLHDHGSDIRYWDQDMLNAVFYNKIDNTPIKFNSTIGFYKSWAQYDCQKHADEVLEASIDPVIIHYTPCKPWKYSRYSIPFKSSFFKY